MPFQLSETENTADIAMYFSRRAEEEKNIRGSLMALVVGERKMYVNKKKCAGVIPLLESSGTESD